MNIQDIPESFKGTIYFYWSSKRGGLLASHWGDWADEDCIIVGQVDVDVNFNTDKQVLTQQAIDTLKQQKQTLQANTQQQLNEIDQQIQSLLAIEHQPTQSTD
jgi:outer membrane protein OmpA-like peptidoglycan-associated protein